VDDVSATSIAVLLDGSVVFTEDNRIRRFDPTTGNITTLAGTRAGGFRDGFAHRAQFNSPCSVTVDVNGSVLVADSGNHRIRCLDMVTNNVTTLAGTGACGREDGPTDRATLNAPSGLTITADGSVFIADTYNNLIRRLDRTTNEVTTVAGMGGNAFRDGPAARAQFDKPRGLAVSADGNVLIADSGNNRIRCLDMTTNNVTTVAGEGDYKFRDGPAGSAQFWGPCSLAVAGNGHVLIADEDNNRIRCLDTTTNNVTTVAGTGERGSQDGPARNAQFSWPKSITVDSNGNVLIANSGIRIICGAPNITPPARLVAFSRSPPRGTVDDRLAAHRARLGRADGECTRLQAQLDAEPERARAKLARVRAQLDADVVRLRARLAASVTMRDEETAAVRELKVEAFRARVVTGGIEILDVAQVHALLRLLGVTTVTPQTLERQEITGAVLPHVTERQMRDVFKMQRLGDRRRLSIALKRLANRQGFPLPPAAQLGALSWGTTEVGDWLRKEGFPALIDRFAAEGIDGPCLLGLGADDLDELGESLTVGQSSRLRQRLEKLNTITIAEEVVRGDDARVASGAEADRPSIQAVLEAVLEDNAELQRRMAERAREPARAAVPAQFLCPILCEVMEDPVVAADGYTYERAAIETWFRQGIARDRSPMTNLPISTALFPNIAIKQQIDELANV
jgi:streptogramin lyase